MNRYLCAGRISNDLEVRVTQNNKKVLSFGVGVKDNDNTIFVPCVAFEKQAEFIQKYFQKGDQIILEGRLNISAYEDKGEKKTRTNVVVERVEFGAKKRSEPKTDEPKTEEVGIFNSIKSNYTEIKDDDLPFY